MEKLISPEINKLLIRQTVAGNSGNPELTGEEVEALIDFYSKRTNAPIPPDINELLRKQTNAGIQGCSNLTGAERQTLKDFYSQWQWR